jgi:hypothetical protein
VQFAVLPIEKKSVSTPDAIAPQLIVFEKYVTSLTGRGIFPEFHRQFDGWICILRNSSNKQIMPFNDKDYCWGETIIDALTVAVEGLNKRFKKPNELSIYIDIGTDY